MPRKKIQWDEKTAKIVSALAKYGITQREIAIEAGICEKVLAVLYHSELERGRAVANAAIGKRLFEKALQGDTACLIFWAKTRMGWRENKDAGPVESQGRNWAQDFRDALKSVG